VEPVRGIWSAPPWSWRGMDLVCRPGPRGVRQAEACRKFLTQSGIFAFGADRSAILTSEACAPSRVLLVRFPRNHYQTLQYHHKDTKTLSEGLDILPARATHRPAGPYGISPEHMRGGLSFRGRFVPWCLSGEKFGLIRI